MASLCLGPYGVPREVGVSYERGTPVHKLYERHRGMAGSLYGEACESRCNMYRVPSLIGNSPPPLGPPYSPGHIPTEGS